MATAPMNTAAKVAKLRKMAEDKSLPQDVRNQYLDDAVKLEEKSAKGAGVKLAKGGSVVAKAPAKKPAAKKMAVGGVVQMTRAEQMALGAQMAQAGPVQKPSPMAPSMKKPLPRPTNKAKKIDGPSGLPMMYGVKHMMAKGGAVKKGKK